MKKIFFSLLAIAAIASCAKTEPVYLEDNSEIKLAPVTSMVTKAQPGAIDGTQYPAAENFDVYAYWAAEGAGSVFTTGYTEYLGTPKSGYGVEFTKRGDWYWGGTTPYYWPKNGSLRFAAYSPADLQHEVKHDLASDTYTVLGYTQPYTTDATFDFLLAPTSVSYTATTAVDDVDVVFEHALSWITLQAKAADAAAAKAFTVHQVIINDVNTVADLEAAMPAKVWSNWATPQAYVVNDAYNKVITEDVAVLDKEVKGTVGIPQLPTTVTVKYTQNALEGTPALENQEVTVPLILDGNANWEPGKHYIYTLIFGLDEILITPSVVDWEDVEVPVIDATATEVNNAADLISAVAAGRNVRLTSNIEVAEPVVVTEDVLVELNGYTVSATSWIDPSDNSDNAYGFWVKSGELTINGPGKVETEACTYSMAVWADGGKVVINGGEYYNAGEGSDLIYAKNGGEVAIYGGYFKACEKQPGANGTGEKYSALNLHGSYPGKITVYGGTFYGFNPANNVSENPAVNFVAPKHNVVASDNGGVAEYTVYAPEGSIALAADAEAYGPINVTDGVFDGGNHTVTAVGPLTSNAFVAPAGNATIQNVTLDGADLKFGESVLRAIYITKGGNYVVDGVTVVNCSGYAINVNTTAPVTLAVKNSTLEGWTSYGNSTTASFENVAFTCGDYANFKPYTTVTLTGCSFENGFMIDFTSLNGVINFKNCKYNNILLTAENFEATVGTNLDGYAADKVAF